MTEGGRLAGRVALVTGGGRGLGLAVAERFGREGARVAIAELDGDRAREAAAALGEGGLGIQCDVARADDVERAFDACLERFGRLDILVNNAAVVGPAVKHFLEIDEPTWDLVLDANLKGHFLCTARAARHMVEQGAGVIINTSSGGASRAHRGMVAYDAAKGGVEAFTRAVALDLAPYGVRCVCIVPGPDGDLRAGARGRGARARDGRDGAARPPGHGRRHRRSGGLPGRRGRRPTSPDRASTSTAACSASSARRRSRRSRSIAFPASAAWPEVPYDTPPVSPHPIGGSGSPRFSPFPDVCAITRAPPGETTTNRGRPQLLHDLSTKLYLMLQRERGQTMAEYAVVLAVIAIGIFAALGFLSGSIRGALSAVTRDI